MFLIWWDYWCCWRYDSWHLIKCCRGHFYSDGFFWKSEPTIRSCLIKTFSSNNLLPRRKLQTSLPTLPATVCKEQGIYPWWRHQMKTFSALLVLCAGNSPVPVNSPHKGQWRGAFMFSLICVWINGWVNNRGAGDLRRHCGHYDVNVMSLQWFTCHAQ